MRSTFTVENVFETAILIERQGSAFYREAAGFATKTALRKRLLELADVEHIHVQRFARIRDLVLDPKRKTADSMPKEEAVRCLKAMAKGGIFSITTDAAQALASLTDMREILTLALERERDSIVFYTGMKELVPKRADRAKIDAIIYEEMAHVVLLTEELKKF